MVVGAGLGLLALFCLGGYLRSGPQGLSRACLVFVPVWLIASLINLTVGVVSAGYTVAQELPILLVVFSLPAVAAIVTARRTKL
jgi:hypothetical protein